MMDDELPDTVKKYLDILDENVEILANIESALEDEKEDEFTSDLKLHDLYDMAEDVAEASKLKRAEFNYVRRQSENTL